MDFDQTLRDLDFEPNGLICDSRRMLWEAHDPTRTVLPEVQLAEIHPNGCQARGTKVYYLRLCTCWPGSNPLKLIEKGHPLSSTQFVAGLIVRQAVLCPAHASYFRDYLAYPLICPGCGLYFESVDEVLLREQDI
ncbi:hypothetical protein AU099_gp42 [Gordonia phage GTE8]|uniref:Uncharacterized protein n=1 Tax=Gordonia phage GTE8 TaxID=1647475 RepID=A0A0K0N6D0_9CAUD|nr:hypothetical protein AU099_gp42 [Gordonia phage GTE8]AKJ72385.1 hypothetical protein GTE8_42 [Gordonia phage GTE8]